LKHDFVANLLPSRVVKNFENRKIVSLVSCFFLTHGVDAQIPDDAAGAACYSSYLTKRRIKRRIERLFFRS